MKNRAIFMMVGAAFALAACSKPSADAPILKGMLTEKQYEERVQAASDELDRIPDWYNENPDKKDSVFSTGTALSPDLQLSKDKAILSAKRVLADRIDGKLQSMTKQFMTEIGKHESAAIHSQVTQVTKNVIADVDVTGYHVTKAEQFITGPFYRTYVQLEFPLAAHNRLMLTKLMRDEHLAARLSASKAFRELQQEVQGQRTSNQKRVEALIDKSPAPPAVPVAPVTTENENRL